MNKVIYKNGDVIGDNGVIYIEECEPHIQIPSKQKKRMAIFKCPICKKYFKAIIANVKNGKVKSCGCYK